VNGYDVFAHALMCDLIEFRACTTVSTSFSSYAIKQIQNGLAFLRRSAFGENIPKPQSLVSGPGNDGLTVWRHRQVQHAIRMSRQLGHLNERRVFPDEDLILTISVSADQFVGVFGPSQIADLRPGIDALQRLSRQSIPESNAPICRTAAGG